MTAKTTMSIEKETSELVKRVKRKLSFDIDQDLTTDETISHLCKDYLAKSDDTPDGVEATAEAVEED